MTLQQVMDPRSQDCSQNISECFSGCIRLRNKNRLLGLLQSGRNPNRIVGDFNVASILINDQEKLRAIEPYLENGLLPFTSVLHEAIIYNDEDVINILLNFGARINDFCGIDRNGLSCLMLAVVLRHNNLFDLLVKRGCNYSLFNCEKQTALDLAVVTNNIEAVNFFAPFKRFFYYKTPKRSRLTVSDYIKAFACNGLSLDVIDQMVLIGYDLGDTPGESILYKLLNSIVIDEAAATVIRNFVSNYKNSTGIDLLQEPVDESDQKMLHVMAKKCNVQCVKILMDMGADANECDHNGDIPLHVVLREPITSKSIEVIGLLLEAGSDLFKRNKNKMSPLDLTLEFAQVHSVIAKFVSLNAHTISRENRVHEFLGDPNAALNVKVIQFLRSRKVTFQSLDRNNQSPLHVLLKVHGATASHDELMKCIDVLLEDDSVCDIVDNDGSNPAMIALSTGISCHIVMRLISGPGCTQHINPRGQDILSIIISNYKARDEEKLSLCQFAVKRGALVNNPSRFGCKSLIAACEEAGLSAQGIPKFLLSKGFKPLREDIDCISTWSLSLLELTLEHCNPMTIRTQFPNILITTLKTFIPRITDSKSSGVNSILSITRKLIQYFHIDVNFYEGQMPVLHLLIHFKHIHNYPVIPLIKELLTQKYIDVNIGHDCEIGTPLDHALRVGEYSIADVLIKSMTNFSKISVHKMALKFGFSGIVKTLLKKGVSVDGKFFERAFGQQDMGIIEEMNWLRNYIRGDVNHNQKRDSAYHDVKKIKLSP